MSVASAPGPLPPTPLEKSPAIELRSVDFAYRDDSRSKETDATPHPVLSGIDLRVQRGSFVSVVGPSGCGKSTLLDLVAGLTTPTSGTIEVLAQPAGRARSKIGYVFQQDVLLPWKTLEENVALGPKLAGADRTRQRAQARDWLRRVGLAGFEDSYPHQVSGGMRRRAAIAQTWITGPEILLMDEPFSSVDVQTRQLLGDELLELWSQSAQTVLFVTHDLEEAVALSDEVLVLSRGPASTVVGHFPVPLPRPRRPLDLRTDPAFRECCGQVWESLRGQVRR